MHTTSKKIPMEEAQKGDWLRNSSGESLMVTGEISKIGLVPTAVAAFYIPAWEQLGFHLEREVVSNG